MTSTNKDTLLTSTVKGAYSLVMLQLMSRMVTFVLHQIVLRYTTAETLGIASVQLELLLSTILFLSREGFRCALLRHESPQSTHNMSLEEKEAEQKKTNVAYIPTVLGLFTSVAVCSYFLQSNAAAGAQYRLSVVLFGMGAMAELLVEPLYIFALQGLYFQTRVHVEGIAVIVRLYWFDRPLLELSINFTKQSLLKHVLTEGDKMLITALSSDNHQGIYAFVVNYDLLVGKKWSTLGNTSRVLSAYCLYVPMMGVNGITEAFMQSTASPSDITRQSYAMVGFSLCFIISGYVGMGVLEYGAIGLVMANMVNVGIRMVYSLGFIKSYVGSQYNRLSVRQWLPHPLTFAAFIGSWIITCWSEHWVGWQTFHQKAVHIGIGSVCFAVVCGVM
ncbi:Rft protein-domain-containing protein [Spinellus fusiger]|nr:Rft protein-domain-containing protein [Spinellus fusiger]